MGGVKLSELNHKQLFIPEGYAHGFYTLSDNAHLIYKVNNHWHQEAERTIIWNDPNLSINWLQLSTTPLLSDKDASGKRIDELLSEEFLMKILITGAEGQLRKKFSLESPSKIKDDELIIIRANKEVLDLSNESACKNIIEKLNQIGF